MIIRTLVAVAVLVGCSSTKGETGAGSGASGSGGNGSGGSGGAGDPVCIDYAQKETCLATGAYRDCVACCEGKNPSGKDVQLQETTCICTMGVGLCENGADCPGPCIDVCAGTYCALPQVNPLVAGDDACVTCYQDAMNASSGVCAFAAQQNGPDTGYIDCANRCYACEP